MPNNVCQIYVQDSSLWHVNGLEKPETLFSGHSEISFDGDHRFTDENEKSVE